MKYIIAALFVVPTFFAIAEPIDVPNTFTSGTKALASEVNENFQTLVTESNRNDARLSAMEANDARLSALEGKVATRIKDQLICNNEYGDFMNLTRNDVANCFLHSDPSIVRKLTAVDIFQDGWFISTTLSGYLYIFNKYED